jgi:hypothetical protein
VSCPLRLGIFLEVPADREGDGAKSSRWLPRWVWVLILGRDGAKAMIRLLARSELRAMADARRLYNHICMHHSFLSIAAKLSVTESNGSSMARDFCPTVNPQVVNEPRPFRVWRCKIPEGMFRIPF